MKRNPVYRLSIFKAALALAKTLPRDFSQEIAGALGSGSYALAESARAALRENLRLATGRGGNDLEDLCRANFASFVKMLADYFYCSIAAPAQIRALLEDWRGFENLTASRARGRGGILITGHLGNWELGGILLALEGVPLTVVTLDEPTNELTKWREEYRRRLGIKTIAVGSDKFAFVEIIGALRRNEFVAMLVDRPYAGSGTPVRLFDQETSFSSAPALLWSHTRADVLPAFVLQTTTGRYISSIDPPIEMSDDAAVAAQRIAHVFESIVRTHPEQWYNYVPLFPPA